ncbi:hypothetical protein HAX54_018910, partial [Datura stramonium]|nr:hypothetical protein [Datura stramonium]
VNVLIQESSALLVEGFGAFFQARQKFVKTSKEPFPDIGAGSTQDHKHSSPLNYSLVPPYIPTLSPKGSSYDKYFSNALGDISSSTSMMVFYHNGEILLP